MREIIFKAKRIDNGEWVEGFLTVMFSAYHIINKNNENIAFPIDEETICQHIGICDKNGRNIWENDIVKHYNVPWEPAQFTKGVVYWNGENLRYERSSEYTPEKPATVNSSCVYEVIGNVFDNPELLEKAR